MRWRSSCGNGLKAAMEVSIERSRQLVHGRGKRV